MSGASEKIQECSQADSFVKRVYIEEQYLPQDYTKDLLVQMFPSAEVIGVYSQEDELIDFYRPQISGKYVLGSHQTLEYFSHIYENEFFLTDVWRKVQNICRSETFSLQRIDNNVVFRSENLDPDRRLVGELFWIDLEPGPSSPEYVIHSRQEFYDVLDKLYT